MKKLLLLLLLYPIFLQAGTTNVIATIIGADSVVWTNGTYIISFRPTPGKSLDQFNVNGATFPQGPFVGLIDGTGTFNITLTDNSTITPSGSMWAFTICPNATFQCVTTSIGIAGASQNLSSTLSAATPAIKIFASPFPKAYNTNQVTAPTGTSSVFYNVIDGNIYVWTGTVWVAISGGTTVSATPVLQGKVQLNEDITQGSAPGHVKVAGIQGKVIDTPTTTGQQPTYNGTKFIEQAKNPIEIRDLPGIDCTAGSDSSTAFQTACSNNVFQRLSTNGCTYLRLDNPVSCVDNFYFDIGNDSHAGTKILGCGGGVGPLITFQRSGHGRIHGFDFYTNGGSYCGANLGLYTQNVLLDNDFIGHPGGFTTTELTFDESSYNGNVTNWVGLGTTNAQNMEYLRIWNNSFFGTGVNSTDIDIVGGNSQGNDIHNNNFSGAFIAFKTGGPLFTFRNNLAGGIGDNVVYGPGGAVVKCIAGAGPSSIRNNSAAERTGNFFINVGCASGAHGPVEFTANDIVGDGTAVPANTYMIDVGATGGFFTFKDNSGNNTYGSRPIIGTTAGGFDNVGGFPGAIKDEGNAWKTTPYDAKAPTLGFHFKAYSNSNFGIQDINSFDELQAIGAWNGYNGTTNPPMKIWRTGSPGLGSYIDYAIGVLDNVYQQNINGNSLILGSTIRNDAALPTGMVIPQSLLGGLKITAAMAIPTPQTSCQGGGSGSTWGYKLSCTSGGSTVYTTAEITQDCSAILDGTHWNRVIEKKTPDYEKCGIWLTTNPGDGRGTGLIGQFNTLSPPQPCPSIDSGQGCDGLNQFWFSTDKGQAVITGGSPPASTSTTGLIDVPKIIGITSTTVVTNLNADTLDSFHAGNASASHAMCWKDATHMGYCSDVVSVTGTCTCN